MFYGYARVSSKDQNEARQLIALQELCIPVENIFLDRQSGQDFNRPAYKKLLRKLRNNDVLYIKSIDRLGRNYDEILEQWRYITKTKGADIVVLDMPLLDTRKGKDLIGTLISDIVLQLLSYVAQTEREFIRQRQREGIDAAKARGVKFGRRPIPRPANYEEIRRKYENLEISARQAGSQLQVSHKTFLRWFWEDMKLDGGNSMAKDFYVRTVRAGRYYKSVRYRRSLPGDSDKVRAAKAATTSKAQRYINLRNSAEKLQMLLCANFDVKEACFCTFTFSEENLPANREMARQCLKSHLALLHRLWHRDGRILKYIYNPEGVSIATAPDAKPAEDSLWEIRPWSVKRKWDVVDKPTKKSKQKDRIRLHLHCFLILSKSDRETVRSLWPYGHVFINPIKIEDPDSFYRLSYYVTKEARNGSLPRGARSYVPSRNLEQPEIESHWCDAHEVLQPPPGAEHVHTANETTDYASFQYCSYRLPRPKRQPKSYKSKGRL